MKLSYSIYASSDHSATITFGDSIDVNTNAHVHRLFNRLRKHHQPFWMDIIPAYTSLTVVYDVRGIRKQYSSAFDWVKQEIKNTLDDSEYSTATSVRSVRIPICYSPDYGMDLTTLAKRSKLTTSEVIELHTGRTYHVFMLGFLPGFAYMGTVHDKIAAPRLSNPHKHVATGSVGIAGNQTGIYPLASPGGWNIIGRTPVRLFNPVAENPVLFKPGDEVKFYSISQEEFDTFDEGNFNPVSA